MNIDASAVIDATRRWIRTMVIGLNLCPFAERVFSAGLVRYVVSTAEDEAGLLQDLERELRTLAAAPVEEVETTLLIHPLALGDFLDYNDFLDPAEQLLETLGLVGVIQIASFHPRYQFADSAADDLENYTNRSPHPMLHLLREESIDRIGGTEEHLLEIPRRNIATLQRLGRDGIAALLRQAALDDENGSGQGPG